jgi:RNA polymerase sigma factor (sigma-70 family)
MSSSNPDRERLAAVFTDCAPRVLAYALRHCPSSAAEEIVSETFLVAWRRVADLPEDPLPWLLVVARNTIANQRRTTQRGARLLDVVAQLERLAAPAAGADRAVIERSATVHALGTLTATEREALLLVAWDGLRPRDAATVAGCSPRAFEVRLHRARARLARALDAPDVDAAVPLNEIFSAEATS